MIPTQVAQGRRKSSGRTPKRRAPARARTRSEAQRTQIREMVGLGLLGAGILLAASLFVGLSVGPVGDWLEAGVRLLVGRAVTIAPLALVLAGLALILDHPLLRARPLQTGAAIGTLSILTALAGGSLGLGGATRHGWFESAVIKARGGSVGELCYWITSSTVGGIGTAMLVTLGLIASALLISGASLGHVLRRGSRGAAAASAIAARGVATATVTAIREGKRLRERIDAFEAPTLVGARRRAGPGGRGIPLVDGADTFPDIYDEPGTLPPSPALGPIEVAPGAPAPAPEAAAPAPAPPRPRPVPVRPPRDEGPASDDEEADEERGKGDGEEAAQEELTPIFTPRPDAPGQGGYRYPSLTLLRRSAGPASQPVEVIERTSRLLEETLGHFGIEASVVGSTSGPRVTRYELQLAPGTKVGRISALRDDLAYSLAAREELRIIAPIPGKQAVGVEVPNQEAVLVTLGDIARPFPPQAGPLMTWLGLELGGKPVYIDLARMPHLLIAGSTGTGKSVCLNAILASILLRSSPDQLRLILIDPKKVELNHYEGIPHLLTPVVTRMKDAAAVLSNLVREMESRYELMGMARARNLRDWNEVRESQGERRLPTILVVIDELADLMMVSPAEVEDAIIRLAQKSRAVGIHLVLATQRPSADVITGMIKANVPSRIAFAVSSQVDSRVILDSGGAETLLGHGDMLFRPVGTSRLQRLQGAYVSEEEIKQITDHWKAQGRPELREELLERADDEEEGPAAEIDDMLERAIELVVQQGTASVSLLQRRLGVGYARAGRLVDAMERMGVVSGHEGSKPRSVLVGEGDLDRLLRRPADDGDEEGAAGAL